MSGRYGREYVNQAFRRADAKNKAASDRKKAGAPQKAKIIKTAPHTGDPMAYDWMNCECGYQRPTSGGKPVPQRLDPAYADWKETGRPTEPGVLHHKVRRLCLDIYNVGYHHNVISLATDPGYPDLTLWGPGGPKMMWREEKSMTGAWQPGQREHLLSIHQSGGDVGVWKPCCYLSGLIDVELANLAAVPPVGRGAQRLRGQLNKPMTWADVAAETADSP